VAARVTSSDVEALRAAITAGPGLFPLEASPSGDALLFVAVSEDGYRDASFLDRRLLGPASRTGVVPRAVMRPWLEQLPRACDFIFHVSHAGSTLLSRLLGCRPELFALREPAILRQVAAADGRDADELRDDVLALLSRTFHPGQRAVVKATSVVNRIASVLMDRVSDARALLMTVPADTFLAAVLDGSPGDIAAHAAERLSRLASFGVAEGVAPEALGAGEAAAMSWLCENLALAEVARRAPDRARWLDFDRFLETPADQLAAAFAAFGLEADVESILAGDLMRRYAKRPDVAYDAAFRRRLLLDARRRLGTEIDAGLAWLDAVGGRGHLAGTPVRVATGDGH
jgi:hypothetical protein